MELTDLELQIVNVLKKVEILNNKEIAAKLNKDPGNISRKMKQLVGKQVVNKKRQSDGKITCNYYSLVDDNIEILQQVVKGDTSCKEIEQLVIPKDNFGKTGLEFLDIHGLLTSVLKYLSEEAKIRLLTSKETRLVRILSEDSNNYNWILNSIILFLSIAKKIGGIENV